MKVENGVLKNVTNYDLDILMKNPKKFWEGVSVIGEGAFKDLNIRSIVVPQGVRKIENEAFLGCSSLQTVELPEGLREIGAWAFSRANELVSINLPESLERLGKAAFKSCGKLESIVIPSKIKELEQGVFYFAKSLKSVTLPEGLEFIGDWAFERSGIESINLPTSLKSFGKEAFSGCHNLKSIVLPYGIKEIPKAAFEYSNIEEFVIPESVTQIGESAFSSCNKLKSIALASSVKVIGNGAFSDCENLTSIKLSEGLKIIGGYAFEDCENLTSIKLPESLEKIGDGCFSGAGFTILPKFPKAITKIPQDCFSACNFKTLDIPSHIEEIGPGAFKQFLGSKIIIPKTVKKVGSYAFAYSDNLVELKFMAPCEIGEYVVNFEDNLEGAYKPRKKPLKITILPDKTRDKFELIYNPEVSKNTCFVNYRDFKYFQVMKGRDFCRRTTYIEDLNQTIEVIRFFSEAMKDGSDIPFMPDRFVYMNIQPKDMRYFFQNSEAYNRLLNEKGGSKVFEDIYLKVCYAFGLFSGDKGEQERAEKFIREVINELPIVGPFVQDRFCHFDELYTRKNGYNKDFADFVIKNWKGLRFLDDERITGINYGPTFGTGIDNAYNYFNLILKAYPNKRVITDVESDRLTPDDVKKFLNTPDYKYAENTDLAKTVNIYGYTQSEFQTLQKWYKTGSEYGSIISAKADASKSPIKFKLLDKSDPLGAVLGNITNSNQTINNMTYPEESYVVKHGITDPNGGFIIFEFEDRIIGQTWVWYNKDIKKICFDNIEIPESAKEIIRNNPTEFKKCLIRAANSISSSMKENGYEVDAITMGNTDFLETISQGEFKPAKAYSGGKPIIHGYANTEELLIPFAQAALASGNAPAPQKILDQSF